MKVLIAVILSLVAVAKSRPDVSHLVPAGSYLPTPSGSYLPGDINYNLAQDQKHVYFHAGSDDDQYSRFKINIAPASHKLTKVIFVKAPAHKGIIPEVVAPPSLSEDRTLVYVLVKNPQDGSITIPAGLGIKHTKPQVQFIKYNNQHDAASQVNAGVQGQLVGSSVPDVGSELAFVDALGKHGYPHAPYGHGGYNHGGYVHGGYVHGGYADVGEAQVDTNPTVGPIKTEVQILPDN